MAVQRKAITNPLDIGQQLQVKSTLTYSLPKSSPGAPKRTVQEESLTTSVTNDLKRTIITAAGILVLIALLYWKLK